MGEEAEPEEWEGLASTKCLSCNRPVTAPDYDEDEFSVVTGATGRTSLGSPVKLDPTWDDASRSSAGAVRPRRIPWSGFSSVAGCEDS